MRKLDRVLAVLQNGANTYTSSGRISVCDGLVKLEIQEDVWGTRYPTFQALVEDNRFCAWNVYEAFKLAASVFDLRTIEKTGFWASLRIASIDKQSLRSMIAREVRRWQLLEGLFTSYQAVDAWLRAKYPEQFPSAEKNSLVEKLRKEISNLNHSYARVVAENQKLKAENQKLKADLAAGVRS